MSYLAGFLGVLLLAITLIDAFEVVPLPRPIRRWIRLHRYFFKITWGRWRRVAQRWRKGPAPEDFIAVNILAFQPGNYFPMVETHVMEHGLYMLEGQGMYLLQNDWHECWTGDFVYMGPYCPQFFYATGWSQASYLLYKDVNRDIRF